jgi:hypothetical protein
MNCQKCGRPTKATLRLPGEETFTSFCLRCMRGHLAEVSPHSDCGGTPPNPLKKQD